MTENNSNEQSGSKLEDLQLYGRLSVTRSLKEDPKNRAEMNKLNRRELLSMISAFACGGAAFYAMKTANSIGGEAYDKKIAEMGGHENVAVSCLETSATSSARKECVDKKLASAWDALHEAAKPRQIIGLFLSAASLGSFAALWMYHKKSNAIQEKINEAHFKDVKTNFDKIKSNDPKFFDDVTPKGPFQ